MLIETQPKTFVITLKDHPISMQQTNDCLMSAKTYEWELEIFWGIYGNTLSNSSWKEKNITPFMDKVGQRGCFFSHLLLWEKCIELDSPIVILEHDAIINCKWKPLEISNSLIKLHKHYRKDPMSHKWVHEITGRWSPSTHAYCITPEHAQKLISAAQTVGAFPADVFMGDKIIDVKLIGEPEIVSRQNTFSTTGRL